MRQAFTIPGRLPGINELIASNRHGWHAGNRLKESHEWEVRAAIVAAGITPIRSRVRIQYTYFEPNRRRDMDNIAGFAHKVVQDALVRTGVLEDDGWRNIAGFTDTFEVDPENPRIEVALIYHGAK